MLDWSQCSEVERNPAKVSGATVKDFLEWFPGGERTQVEAVLASPKPAL
jgi:hypothetical protein